MTRIENLFKSLDRPAMINFITAGDPDYKRSLSVMKAVAAGGADIIELGMPFTDPVADGEAIQLASQRALAAGASMHTTLQMVRDFRSSNTDTPIVLMGYYNPVLQYGLDAFAKDASDAGVDGLIIVDVPPEEADDLLSAIAPYDIDLIRLLTPTSDEQRLPTLLKGASGFLYYVSITGVTGTAQADHAKVSAHIKQIKGATDLPIAIGFGIKTPDDVQKFAAIGDAVVVGSSIVQTIASNAEAPDLADKVSAQVSALVKPLVA